MINKNISFQPKIIHKENILYNVSEKSLSIYIHFPFCNCLCAYCGTESSIDFNNELLNQYLIAIKKEIVNKKEFLYGFDIKSIHIGGGTPSVLNENQIIELIEFLNYQFGDSFELIFEAHPKTLSREKIKAINLHERTSLNIGIQSFNENVLKYVDRDNDIDEKISLIRFAVENKRLSVGIDLICGLPMSNTELFIEDVKKAIYLGFDHLAIYPLWQENSSRINKKKDFYENILWSNENKEVALDLSYKILESNNYKRYSMFHFSSKDKPTHTYGRNQMEGKEWIGIGAGATSYINNKIFSNTKSIKNYIDFVDDQNGMYKYLNDSDRILRDFLFNLRMFPFDLEKYKLKTGDFIFSSINTLIKILIEKNLIIIEGNNVYLTTRGILSLGEIEDWVMSGEKL